jgi:hypothetical protein
MAGAGNMAGAAAAAPAAASELAFEANGYASTGYPAAKPDPGFSTNYSSDMHSGLGSDPNSDMHSGLDSNPGSPRSSNAAAARQSKAAAQFDPLENLVEDIPASSPSAIAAAIASAAAHEPSLGSAAIFNTNNNETFPLLTRHLVIGRDLGCDITINDANASRQHACLAQNAVGSWKLIDSGSTNGTLLNGRPATQAVLRDGDLITIGTTVLEFQA